MRWLVLILFSCSVLAQDVVPNRRRDFQPSLPYPQTLSQIEFYWVASDMPVGITVSNWLDRIQSLPWTNGVAAQRPTNAPTGVFFNGTNAKLTNTASINNAVVTSAFLIMKCLRTSQIADGFWTDIPGNTGAGFDWSSGTVATPQTLTALWNQPTSIFQDWLTLIAGGGTPKAYTNNVQSHSGGSQFFGTINGMGLGVTQAGGAPGNFYLTELAIYTNLDITATATIRSNFHYYATNVSKAAPFTP